MVSEILNNTFFFLVVIFSFTIPGALICKPLLQRFSFGLFLTLSTVVGFVAFTLLAYVTLFVKVTFLIIPVLIICSLILLRHLPIFLQNCKFKFSKGLITLTLILILGIAGQMLIISPSGRILNGDLIFYSSHGHDGPWHIALMEEIKKGFPLQNPSLSGERLLNYHFFSDISPAVFNQYLGIPYLELYFRMFPFLFSLLLGLLSFHFGKFIGGSFESGVLALFFTYFAGSLGYIVTLARNHSIGGESLFWASQVQSSSGNPPLIASFIILLAILLILKEYVSGQKTEPKVLFILFLLLGSLVEFKSYAGVVALLSIGLTSFLQLIKERRIDLLVLFIFSAGLSLSLYLPNASGFGGFLILEPWWFIRTMIVAPDRLNWIDLELRRQTYIAEGNWKRVIQIESTGFLIFLFGNLGMRFIGLLEFTKNLLKSLTNPFYAVFSLACIISLILPLLFLQKGVAGNTIQFLQFFLLLTGIMAGVTTSKLLRVLPFSLRVLFIILLITLSIPTQAGLIYSFYNRPPITKITGPELEALQFLKTSFDKSAIILNPPFQKGLLINEPILPIWAWSDSSYISAFSGRRTYLSDAEQADIMGYDIKKRLEVQKNVYETTDREILEKSLKKNGISILYFPKLLAPKVDLEKTNLLKIFSNQQMEIWKLNSK